MIFICMWMKKNPLTVKGAGPHLPRYGLHDNVYFGIRIVQFLEAVVCCRQALYIKEKNGDLKIPCFTVLSKKTEKIFFWKNYILPILNFPFSTFHWCFSSYAWHMLHPSITTGLAFSGRTFVWIGFSCPIEISPLKKA